MPNKLSRPQAQDFYCPYCQQRLWRTGSTKYHLRYQNDSQIQQDFNTSRKKTAFSTDSNSVFVDRDRWIEEFFCPEHSIVWLLISRQTDGSFSYTETKERDWQQNRQKFSSAKCQLLDW